MCLTDIEAWLRASRLRLNPTKIQVMWLGSSQQLAKLDITHVRVLSSYLRVQDTARDLGVVIDSQLSLSAHVAAVCRCGAGCYQLRQLRLAVRSLSEDASFAQAFASCRLDYCNYLHQVNEVNGGDNVFVRCVSVCLSVCLCVCAQWTGGS